MLVKFSVPGEPQGKARARTYHNANGAHTVTPEKTVLYENLVKAMYWTQEKEIRFPKGVPVVAMIDAYFSIPKSTSKKKAEQMRTGAIRPTKKPDVDNICKAVLDGLNKVAYDDDAQVVSLVLNRWYSDDPHVEVALWADEQKEGEGKSGRKDITG